MLEPQAKAGQDRGKGKTGKTKASASVVEGPQAIAGQDQEARARNIRQDQSGRKGNRTTRNKRSGRQNQGKVQRVADEATSKTKAQRVADEATRPRRKEDKIKKQGQEAIHQIKGKSGGQNQGKVQGAADEARASKIKAQRGQDQEAKASGTQDQGRAKKRQTK